MLVLRESVENVPPENSPMKSAMSGCASLSV
jgi:hypothetical protein